MRVFITGGTGLIGSAVVTELLDHGHQVLALARSEASADKLRTAGAEPVRGGLADHDVLRAAIAGVDGVIHLAFSNDFSSPEAPLPASPRRRPPWRSSGQRSSAATVPWSPARGPRSPRGGPPPRTTRSRSTARSAAAAAP